MLFVLGKDTLANEVKVANVIEITLATFNFWDFDFFFFNYTFDKISTYVLIKHFT